MIYEFVIYKGAGYNGAKREVVSNDDMFTFIDDKCEDPIEAVMEMLETGSYEFTCDEDNYVYIVAIEPLTEAK